MKLSILSQVVEELSSVLPGSRIERVFESGHKEILLLLYKMRKKYILLLSPERSVPRVHLVLRKPAPAAAGHPFTQYLKSRMTGARIAGIGLLNRDRVVEVRFFREGAEHRLIFELTGSAPNMVVTDHEGVILAVYYPASASESGRPLLQGIRYELPAKKASVPLSTASGAEKGHTETEKAAASANREAELYYDHLLKQRRFESLKNSLRTRLKKLFTRAERRYQAVSADQKAARNLEEYKRAGDLILANLSNLRTGMKTAELRGYDDIVTSVSLDEKRSPAANAELYFKKYKKAKSGRDIIAARLKEAGVEKVLFETLLADLEKAEEESDLVRVGERIPGKGAIAAGPGKKGKPEPPPQSFRKMNFEGWEILIGKNAAGNDYITTKLAQSHDLWLHAEGLPGSHVLVRNPQNRDIPPEVLKKAASLAAYYSKGRRQGKTAVTFTVAGQVRKPKGAKAGQVMVSKRKTIMAAAEKE